MFPRPDNTWLEQFLDFSLYHESDFRVSYGSVGGMVVDWYGCLHWHSIDVNVLGQQSPGLVGGGHFHSQAAIS